MRCYLHGLLLLLIWLIHHPEANAQNCISTGLNGSIINLPCNTNCTQVKLSVPHLKSTSDYKLISIPYSPLPYTTPGGTELTTLYQDDVYAPAVALPFPFCFYDSLYTQAVVGSNGLVTFDIANSGCANAYTINPPIPSAGSGTICSQGGIYYPRAAIMAMYSDLDPRSSASPSDRKIEWRLEGTAPCRRLVVSYYHVGIFGSNTCGLATPNTFQIIMYESTGMIDINIEQKACYSTTGNGLAILGVQNWLRDKAVASPGRNATQWSENNTAYRFVPSGNASRFVKAELYDLGMNLLQTTTPADTTTTTPGLLDIKFANNVCPTAQSTQYIVKTIFSSCADPNTQLFSLDTITVNKTTSLGATTTTTPAACGPNGSITVNIPTGAGTLPYQISIDGGLPVTTSNQSYTFSNLLGGAHTITIVTAGGCSQTINVTIPVSGTLTVTHTVQPTSCNGAANGSFTITPQNGVAPFLYSLNGNPPQASGTFSNLPPGNYIIKIADAGGCVLNNYIVNVPNGTTIPTTMNVLAPSCPGINNGSITVTATGTAPYQYSIGGNPFQGSNVFSNLAPGNYFIQVKDAANCTSGLITVTVPPSSGALQVNLTPTGTSCTGAVNGSIAITPTSGSGPYQYSVNGGSFQTGTQITGLAGGSYTVIVKDASGCSSAPQTVTVPQGSALLATTTVNATSCPGLNNGKITVTPTNGSTPYQYQLDGGSFQAGNTFSNLTPGAHTVVVKDGAGCTSAPISITVPTGAALQFNTTVVNTSCLGAANGSITATPINGTAPYQYSFDNAALQSGATQLNLPAGAHTVVIQDNVGCMSAPVTVNINAGAAVTASVNTTPVSCNGGNNGTATVSVSANATAPVQYSLDGVTYQPSNTFSGLSAGNYTVYVKEAANCAASQTFTITEPTAITGTVTKQAVICNGQSNGVLTITANGGTPGYQYSVNGTTYQSSNTFNLAAGSYPVYIKDANGCVKQLPNEVITQPAAVAGTTQVQNATCNGGANGVITVNASGGVGPYEYSLNNGAYQNANSFNVLSGTYAITVKDANGCTFPINGIVVGLTNDLTVTPAPDEVICESKSVTLQPNTNGTQFSWSPATALSSSSIRNPVANPVTTTSYIVTITYGNCVAYDTIVVNVNPAPVPDAGPGGTVCFGQTFTLNGSGGTTYDWTPAADVQSGNGTANPVVKPGSTRQFSLLVTDANGCRSLVQDTVTVVITPPFQVYTNPPDTVGYIGDTIHLLATSPGINYVWTPSTGLSDPYIANPVLTVTKDQIYSVEATTAAGCKGITSFKIQAFVGPEIYVPNAFTPDGDGKNDRLRPFPVGIQTLHFFKVFNRWGQEVYSWSGNSRGPEVYQLQLRTDIGWDGKIMGAKQATQTYVWVAEGVTKEGKVIQRKGTSVLIR